MKPDPISSRSGDMRDTLLALIHRLEHVLPAQAPIRDFVHHNTLHGFQHLPFPEALAAARRQTGAAGYLPAERFRELYAEGRIADTDLQAAIDQVSGGAPDESVTGDIRRRDVWLAILRHPLKRLSRTQLRWFVQEQAVLRTFQRDTHPAMRKKLLASAGTDRESQALLDLWTTILDLFDLEHKTLHPEELQELSPGEIKALSGDDRPDSVDSASTSRESRIESEHLLRTLFNRLGDNWTLRHLLLALSGEDILDELRPTLIRHVANHLDQGLAAWHNPERARGLYASWRAAAEHDAGWLVQDLPEWRLYLERLPADPLEAIIQELRLLGLGDDHWPGYLERLALEIPGWSGMTLWRSQHPGYAGSEPPVSMIDYLAVCLVMERMHAQRLTRRHWGLEATLPVLRWYFRHNPSELVARYALFEGRLPEYLVTLGQRQAQEALQHKKEIVSAGWTRLARLIQAWRLAPAQDRQHGVSVSGTAWPLFVLCQHLGLGGERLRQLGRSGAEALWQTAQELDEDRTGYLWLVAYERHYREQIFGALAANHGRWKTRLAAEAQLIFCMDDREEGMRRHVEEINPKIETYGAAGFFGVAMNWAGLDDQSVTPLCPIVVTPAHEVREIAQSGHERTKAAHDRNRVLRLRWRERLYQDSRLGLVTAMLTALVAAPWALLALAGRLLWPRLHANSVAMLRKTIDRPVPTQLLMSAPAGSPPATPQLPRPGFTEIEQADRVHAFLRTIGLTKGFAPVVVLFGHGSSSQNNPHLAAYDCGACSGRHGGPNARVFAAMANNPAVRSLLAARGLHIPDHTWFLGAEHNTCDDSFVFYDEDRIPLSLTPALMALKSDLRKAAHGHAQERCRRFASAPIQPAPKRAARHVEARMQDLSQPRPELGHVTNATAFIGRRDMSRGAFFDRRAFLLSYDPTQDVEGHIVENILLAAGPVGAGIALEYYFSTVNNEQYGCGTKTVHNLTGLFGVMEGTSSDLRTGLPQQMIEIHEAMRLLIVVEQNTEVLTAIYHRQPPLQELIGNGWVILAAKDPDSATLHLFDPAHGWQRWEGASTVPTVDRSSDWFSGHRGPLTPSLLNVPVLATGPLP